MKNCKKIIGIIPARSGSKRIPNKNIKDFIGKPLVQHIIEKALLTNILDDIVVTSDSDAVLKISNKYDKIISIKRPYNLATDKSLAIDYVKHALDILKNTYKKEYDIIVILQPTSPLTLPIDIENTIKLLLETDADSAVSVVKVSHMLNPFKLKILDKDKLFPYLVNESDKMASHQIPVLYVRNCSVYVTNVKTIKNNNIIGEDCRGYIMPPERSIDINEPIDFEFAKYLYINGYK